jgi:hypothetical protein
MLWGCASGPARTALQGDLTHLKAAVADAQQRGALGRSDVRELAGAVLHRELVSLPDPVERFPAIGACASGVRPALEEVAGSGSGEAALLASLALIDAGVTPPKPPEQSLSHVAIEARQALGVDAQQRRRAFFLHGDADVRRAAVEAARESALSGDIDALLEVARLDPDAQARALAVVALGTIGGRRAVLGLDDVWVSAADELRPHIVSAWAAPASLDHGGSERLVNVAESAGRPAVLAALALERSERGPEGLARSVLLRAIAGASAEDRLLSLYHAPWSEPEIQEAIRHAQSSKDGPTRVIASLRLVENGAFDSAARDGLRELSEDKSSPVGVAARAVLARAGDDRVKPGLRADLGASHSEQRTLAAFALVALDDWSGAAAALSDDSPEVRQTVACQILADPTRADSDDPAGAGGEFASREPGRARFLGVLEPELLALLAPPESR